VGRRRLDAGSGAFMLTGGTRFGGKRPGPARRRRCTKCGYVDYRMRWHELNGNCPGSACDGTVADTRVATRTEFQSRRGLQAGIDSRAAEAPPGPAVSGLERLAGSSQPETPFPPIHSFSLVYAGPWSVLSSQARRLHLSRPREHREQHRQTRGGCAFGWTRHAAAGRQPGRH
jgi:hypothetical protein